MINQCKYINDCANKELLIIINCIFFLNGNIFKGLQVQEKYIFFKKSLGNLLIIIYQLMKFGAPGYNSFGDILIIKFHSGIMPQRKMIQK